jgi:hypothetical protein
MLRDVIIIIGSIGKYFQKVKTYRPVILNETERAVKSRLDESAIYLKKSYLQHWAVCNLKKEFLVPSKNTWDPHPVNITKISAIKTNYQTLAESDRGPHVIILIPHSLIDRNT